MNSRFLVGLTLVVVATTAHACQSKANKTADKIVDGKWIEAKPPPNAELIHWSITVTRDKQGVPNSVVYLVVHTHKHLVTKVTGNEIKPMDRELYVGWHIPSKAVTACSGWFAGGGDFYYVLKTSDRLRIYHRAIDESDKKLQRPELIKTLKLSSNAPNSPTFLKPSRLARGRTYRAKLPIGSHGSSSTGCMSKALSTSPGTWFL